MLGSVRRTLHRIRALDGPRRRAVAVAAVRLLHARLLLRLRAFPVVLKGVEQAAARPASGLRRPLSPDELRRMIWAVNVVGRRMFPNTPCLTQAVVTHGLLLRNGHPSQLRIGVRKDGEGRFGAHAWVESEGRVVVGGEALSEGFEVLRAEGC